MSKLFFLLSILIFVGCNSIPLDSIGFCFERDGKKYCGDIGLNQGKTNQEKSLVITKTPKNGKEETLYTFTEEEIRVFASQLASMNLPGIAAKSLGKGKQPEYLNPKLTDYKKCKTYVTQQLK